MLSVHADIIGSLLRPPELLAAQKQLAAGVISQDRFKAIEDRAVDDAIALQESVGLEVVTDGEMRRQSFQSQMTAAVDGFGDHDLDAFLWGDWHDDGGVHRTSRPSRLGVVSKLKRQRYLSVDEFVYLKSKTKRIPKLTLPSPGLWANFWSAEYSKGAYPTLESDEVAELTRFGASYVQIDAPHYGLLLAPQTRRFYENQGWSIDQWLSLGIDLDNAVMSGFPSVTFGFHI